MIPSKSSICFQILKENANFYLGNGEVRNVLFRDHISCVFFFKFFFIMHLS